MDILDTSKLVNMYPQLYANRSDQGTVYNNPVVNNPIQNQSLNNQLAQMEMMGRSQVHQVQAPPFSMPGKPHQP